MTDTESDTGYTGSSVQGEEEWTPRFSNRILLNSDRTTVVLMHRIELQAKKNSILENLPRLRQRRRSNSAINTYGRENMPKKFAALTPIYLSDLDVHAEAAAEGKRVELEIIEPALIGEQITLIGQDARGRVVLVVLKIRNLNKKDTHVQQKVGFGTRISIGNPFLVRGVGLLPTLEVESDEDLFIHRDKHIGKCRFCFKRGPNRIKCHGCDRVFYCSKKCHTADWKTLKHHLICQDKAMGRKQHGDDDGSVWRSLGPAPYFAFVALGVFYYYFVASDPQLTNKISAFFSQLW